MSEEEKKQENLLNSTENNLPEEDDVVEFEFNEDGEEDLKKTLKKLRTDLKLAKKEREEYLTGWQKERADFINYKKLEEDRKVNFSENMREMILSRFLPVMDSFSMAFSNKEAWEKVDINWRTGVEYIYSQMISVFEEYGVRPIGEIGEAFDPNLHQSIEVVETSDQTMDHKIASVIQKGYKLGDRVIRAARVNVYGYKKTS